MEKRPDHLFNDTPFRVGDLQHWQYDTFKALVRAMLATAS
jgi:hypothetical protein